MPLTNKTYYFCRVFFDYFNCPVIANILRKMNGADVVILHQKLIMLTANTDNVYHYYGDDNDADHVAELAYNLRVDANVVKEGIEILFRYGLVLPCEGGIYVPLMAELIDTGSITAEGIRKSKQRNKKALEGQKGDRGWDNVPTDKDKEIEIESDIEIDEIDSISSIISHYNVVWNTRHNVNSEDIRVIIRNALTLITPQEATRIIDVEHTNFEMKENKKAFKPNIGWMFGRGLQECLGRIKKNNYHQIEQHQYDIAALEKELLSN